MPVRRKTDRAASAPVPVHATAARPEAPRLLLISYHFAPSREVGALRWQKLVDYAVSRGWGVDVFALDPKQLRSSDVGQLDSLPPGVRVFAVPQEDLPIERAGLAAWMALRSLVWPRRTTNGAGPAAPRRESLATRDLRWWPRERRDLVRAAYAWLEYLAEGLWARDAARLALAIAEPGLHRAVITCGPPQMAHRAGVTVARTSGLPLVMDLRDPWSLLQRAPEHLAHPLRYWLARWHEREAMRHAGLVITTTDGLRNAMAAAYPAAADRIITVFNGFDDDPLPPADRARRFIVAYAGTIYIDRDPRLLFRAAGRVIRRLQLSPADFGIALMGQVHSYDGEPIERIAEEEGVTGYLQVRPSAPRTEAFRFLREAAMLVVLPQDSDMAIPAKVFEYMRFDAWILALAEPHSAVASLLRGTEADVVSPADLDGIAAALERRLVQHQGGQRGIPLARDDRFSRRAQAGILFDAVERMLSRPARAPASTSVPVTPDPSTLRLAG